MANAEKILSLYDTDVRVIVRGKAGAKVEFGNRALIGENRQGVILDHQLFQESAPADSQLLFGSLLRVWEGTGRHVGSRRATVVFDRGGFSPALFQKILEAGFDLLTYRKGRVRRIPARCFREHRTRVEGRTFTYRLADQQVRLLKGKLRLRQVTRQKDDGHQTPILTSRRDLSPAQVAYRMFNRWRQENCFKSRIGTRHRRCPFRRFPYAVLCSQSRAEIRVAGVMDLRRDPQHIERRRKTT